MIMWCYKKLTATLNGMNAGGQESGVAKVYGAEILTEVGVGHIILSQIKQTH